MSFFAAGATCGDNAGVPPAALRIALDVSGAELSTINYAFAEFLHRSDFWTAFLVVRLLHVLKCAETCICKMGVFGGMLGSGTFLVYLASRS